MEVEIGPPRLTKYERARIVGARALQIALGSPIFMSLPEDAPKDPVWIAEEELNKGVIPIIVRRRAPNGEVQDIPLKYLLEPKRN